LWKLFTSLFWANPVWTLQHMFLLFLLFIIVPIISCRITKKSIVIMVLNGSWTAKIVTGTNQEQFSTSVWISYLTSLLSYFCLPLLVQLIQFNSTYPIQSNLSNSIQLSQIRTRWSARAQCKTLKPKFYSTPIPLPSIPTLPNLIWSQHKS